MFRTFARFNLKIQKSAKIVDRQSEELFLDFKRSADNGAGSKLHDTDRNNLKKAISGFGNSEGGIIVWGIECKGTISSPADVAKAKVPIDDPKRFLSWLEGSVSGRTVPPHSHVRHCAIASGSQPGKGFVVTFIPKSYLAPHQCVSPMQYYIRAGSDFVPAPHGVIAGLFGHPPQPVLYHKLSLVSVRKNPYHLNPAEDFFVLSLGILLGSNGPGLARDVYVTINILSGKMTYPRYFRPLGKLVSGVF